ncbi:hypothetical protein KSP40_PGU008608 [Platanthera guangdongensis]|uniref:Uncharacterized protein n=1 Tax=Platanthera guangdongensis TaxID=2320717 RepID=A0ABR2M4K6_9ASPA
MSGKQKCQEPCKKEACGIQSCLTTNNFNPQRCKISFFQHTLFFLLMACFITVIYVDFSGMN